MNWKKAGKRLLFPHPAAVALLTLFAAAGLIYAFTSLEETDVRRIALYALSFYALSFYALTVLCLRVPAMAAYARRFRRENGYYLR